MDRSYVSITPPIQTERANFWHSAFRSVANQGGLAQAPDPRHRKGLASRAGLRPAHLLPGGPLLCPRFDQVALRHTQADSLAALSWVVRYGRTRDQRHYLPTSLGSTVVSRFFATTDALTPVNSCFAIHRGSLIHVTRTSNHSVSNHLRFPARRVPLPQRWQHYFVRASPYSCRLAETAGRIEFTLKSPFTETRHYGLVVHFQLLSTWGYRPSAVTFSYWPYSVGQVADFHRSVRMRFQAHN
jgi:hypothetical protein